MNATACKLRCRTDWCLENLRARGSSEFGCVTRDLPVFARHQALAPPADHSSIVPQALGLVKPFTVKNACRSLAGVPSANELLQTTLHSRSTFTPWGDRMFNWLHKVFGRSEDDDWQRFLERLDALNATAGGGKPTAVQRSFGRLKLRSGTLALGDPQYLPGLELPNIAADHVEISASLWQYPSGVATVTSLQLAFGEPTRSGNRRKIGEVGIDSAKLVVADKADLDEHWTETGPDRIGVISTAPDNTVLRLLTKRFQLQTVYVNSVRADVVGPVSEQLAAEIEAFLKSDPKYSKFPFLYFHIQTNNSFDRANHVERAWQFIPIGNCPEPQMFVCATGRGDGCYDVQCEFAGDVPQVLDVTFVDEDEWGSCGK